MKEAATRAAAAVLAAALAATPALADGPKVSRLPGVAGQSPDILSNAKGDLINLTLTRGHAPEIARTASAFALSLRNDAVTPRVLRELVILRTALIVGSDYEINQHIPMIRACGYSREKMEAVKDWRRSPLFDEKERAILGFVDQMAKGGDVDDPTYDALASRFPPREIVEIALTVGNYVGTGIFTKALRIEIETDGRQASLGKC